MQSHFQTFFKPVSKVSQLFSRKEKPGTSNRLPERPNFFALLPDDLVSKIVKQALPSDVYEGRPTLQAMSTTDKRMKRIAQPRLQRLKAMNLCWDMPLRRLDFLAPESPFIPLNWSGSGAKRTFMPLNWISPAARQKLLNDLHRPAEILSVLDGLLPQLAFFEPEQREKLLQKVLRLWNANQKTEAICKFATKGMSELKPGQRSQLLRAALDLEDEKNRAQALKGFGAGLAYLLPEEREDVVNQVLDIENHAWRGHAIAGLGAGLKHLKPAQRHLLVERTLKNPEETGRANVIRHWGPEALSELTPEQRNSLVDMAFKLRNPEEKKRAFYGLSKSLPLFTPEQRDRLIHEPLGALLEYESGKPVPEAESITPQIWGEQLSHITPMQRERLVNATRNLRSPWNQIRAIKAFVRGGLNNLTCEQRQALVNIILELSDRWYQTKGIRKLAIGGLKHLTPDQRAALVQAALALPDSDDRAKAVNGIARGGLQYLTEDQRATLVTAVFDLTYSANQAIGINGLGRGGLEHLTPDQRAALVQKTWALPRDNWSEAISGLGAGWKDLMPQQRATLLSMTHKIDSSALKVVAIRGLIGGILKADEHWLGEPSRQFSESPSAEPPGNAAPSGDR